MMKNMIRYLKSNNLFLNDRGGAIAEGFVGGSKDMTDEEFYMALRKICGMNCD